MTAELTKDGVLIIRAELELEAYALKKWMEDNSEIFSNEKKTKGIIVSLDTESSYNNCGRR